MKRYLRFLLGVTVAALAMALVKHWPALTRQAEAPPPGRPMVVNYDALYPDAAEAAMKARATK